MHEAIVDANTALFINTNANADLNDSTLNKKYISLKEHHKSNVNPALNEKLDLIKEISEYFSSAPPDPCVPWVQIDL